MATLFAPRNRYIDQIGTSDEQDLYLSLSGEIISMFGFDMVYFPRDVFHTDDLLGRTDAQFGRNATLVMLIEDPGNDTDISGQAEMYNKFGVKYEYDISVSVTQQAFWECFGDGYTPTKGDVFLVKNPDDVNKNLNIPFTVMDVDYINLEQFGGVNGVFKLSAKPYESTNEEFVTNDPQLQELKNSFDTQGTTSYNESDIISDLMKDIKTFNPDNPFAKSF
jgi:hypothetical protein